MRLGLLLILLSFPLIELAVLIKAAQAFGFWWTILWLVAAAVGGGMIIQRQGLAAINRTMQSMRDGEAPITAAVDSGFVVLAGTLLIIPGLITDACGLALLVGPVRRLVARWMLGRMNVHVEVRTPGPGPHERPGRPSQYDGNEGGVVIEGEYERIDDPDEAKKTAGSPSSGAGSGRRPHQRD